MTPVASRLSPPLRRHALQGAIALAVAAVLALVARAEPPPLTGAEDGEPLLAAALRARDGLEVDVLVWADGAGPLGSLGDALTPHTFVVSARRTGESNRDVFLGHARLGPEGAPLYLSRLSPLTSTADADETDLAAAGPTAAFVTRFNGRATGITVLHLRGDLRPEREPWLVGLQRDVENLVHTGRTAGIAIRRFFFDHAAAETKLLLVDEGAAVEVRWRTEAGAPEASARIDALGGSLTGDGAAALTARPLAAPDADWLAWSVNTARDVEWLGTERIELAKQIVFGALDAWKRLTWSHADVEGPAAPVVGVGAATGPLAALVAGASPLDGPPPPVPPAFGGPRKGEGTWEPLSFPVALPGAPTAFWTTLHRPDPEREFAWVRLVAMDPRQLDLHMVGGTEHPRSPTGFADTGMVPADASVRRRLVAAFSGGFQAVHGAYGMVTERGVLLPPKPGAATLATARDGTIHLGAWPADPADAAKGVPVPPFLVALRQNLPPLVSDGVVNPTKRRMWGYTLEGEDPVFTWRSALGVMPDGRLVFGVGPSLSAESLGAAMKAAGCTWAMHLDMNISNIHFELFRPAGEGPALPSGAGAYRGRTPARPGHAEDLNDAITLTTSMWLSGFPRYLATHERDFFYLTAREVMPPAPLPGAGDASALLSGAGRWETTGVPTGATAWPPIAAHTYVAPDPARPADRVELLLLEEGIASLELVPESAPPADDATPALIVLNGRGIAAETPFGARLGGREKPPLRGAATLAVGPDGAARIGRFGVELLAVDLAGAFIQGPSLVEGGKLVERYAAWWEPRPRWGVGVTAGGRIVLALGVVASDKTIAQALLLCGVVTALDLSAGAGPRLALAAAAAAGAGSTEGAGWVPRWASSLSDPDAGAAGLVGVPIEPSGLRARIRFSLAAPRPRVVVGKMSGDGR